MQAQLSEDVEVPTEPTVGGPRKSSVCALCGKKTSQNPQERGGGLCDRCTATELVASLAVGVLNGFMTWPLLGRKRKHRVSPLVMRSVLELFRFCSDVPRAGWLCD